MRAITYAPPWRVYHESEPVETRRDEKYIDPTPPLPPCVTSSSFTFIFKCGLAQVANNRWCWNIGRAHKSNHVFLVTDLSRGEVRQHCHDQVRRLNERRRLHCSDICVHTGLSMFFYLRCAVSIWKRIVPVESLQQATLMCCGWRRSS